MVFKMRKEAVEVESSGQRRGSFWKLKGDEKGRRHLSNGRTGGGDRNGRWGIDG